MKFTTRNLIEREYGFAALLGFILVWIMVNFNNQIGTLYGIMVVITVIFILALTQNNRIRFPIEFDTERISDWAFGLMAYGVFFILGIIITPLITSAVGKEITLSVLTSMTTAPIFATSIVLQFIAFGLLIPLVETHFFARFYEWLGMVFKVDIINNNIKKYILWIVVSVTFMYFHLTARALSSNGALVFDSVQLVMTFMFMLITMWLIAFKKELSSAMIFHVITNSVATATLLGWLGV